MNNWITVETEREFVCCNKISPINVTLVPLM